MKIRRIIVLTVILAFAFFISTAVSYIINIAPVTLLKISTTLYNQAYDVVKETANITDNYTDITSNAAKLDKKYENIFSAIKTNIDSAGNLEQLENSELELMSAIREIINLTEFNASVYRLNNYKEDMRLQINKLSRIKQKYNFIAAFYNKKTENHNDKFAQLPLFDTQN